MYIEHAIHKIYELNLLQIMGLKLGHQQEYVCWANLK